jgi:hypothetical protein
MKVSRPGTPVNVTLTDSGPFDAAPGDGIFTGTFTPTTVGVYTALLTLRTGFSAIHHPHRTAVTQFEVTQPLATLGAFADSLQADGVTVTAIVSVQTAGLYSFDLELKAPNQRSVRKTRSATLLAGSQQMAVTFSKDEMFELGVNGPYQRVNARLLYKGGQRALFADVRADAGVTSAYSLDSFRPSVHFTNQNSAAGVVTIGGPAFNLLRVQMGVYNSAARNCTISATLTTLAGARIDYTSVYKPVAAGTTSVSVDFDGYKVGRSGNGPYLVTDAGLSCRKQEESGSDFTAQFDLGRHNCSPPRSLFPAALISRSPWEHCRRRQPAQYSGSRSALLRYVVSRGVSTCPP